jgi:nitrate/TMAO reductase-like tetraheme cytochrome c subunit
MRTRIRIFASIMILTAICGYHGFAQISPGDLSDVHSQLEGMSNCTQCHSLGDKVSDDKCLACHTEIKERIDQNKGYHSSSEVRGKSCFTCHNDHHGKTFEIIRFEKNQFNHDLAGYKLLGAHSKKACEACHKPEYIKDQKIKNKKYHSYLGLHTDCLACHADYHENTLSKNCTDCHDYEAFKPALKFDHNNTKFKLVGKHAAVSCTKCHKFEIKDGREVKKFVVIPFASCTNCHTDVHKNQFGPDCRQCHNEESFHTIQGMADFDHNKTRFPLVDKHQTISCKLCHKTALTDPVKHDRCSDCHIDYHTNQFSKQGITPDCSACHSTKGFAGSSYTIEKHNESVFPLEGAHLATPCFACHQKTEKWNFREIGIRCSDCHTDIHDSYIDKKYYPEANCKNCHSVVKWSEINFDHATTDFPLAGAHLNQTCRTCHFIKNSDGNVNQRFFSLTSNCTDCHKDVHAAQFENNGVTNCTQCHGFDNWKNSKFDHNTARFVLDGRHKDVACIKCHKPVQAGDLTYIQYKLNDFKCEDCHQ